MKGRTTGRIVASLILCMTIASIAQAQTVQLKVTGVVEGNINPALNMFPNGRTMEAIYTFELNVPDLNSSPNIGLYQSITSLTVRVGDYTATGSVGRIATLNDIGSTPQDIYKVSSESATGPWNLTAPYVPGVGAGEWFAFQLGWEATQFADDSLPPTRPSFACASSNDCFWQLMFRDNGTLKYALSGHVTSVTFAGNTQTGSGVSVTPTVTLPDGSSTNVALLFNNVTAAGDTTVTATIGGPGPKSGFKLMNPPIYYDITTTATFSGLVRVCLSWAEGQIANENKVVLMHYDHALSEWVDITNAGTRDPVNNIVCGLTTSLSPFTLMETKYAFAGFYAPVDNLPVRNSVKAGAAVPVKFGLGGDQGLDVFAAGYPRVQLIQCDTLAPIAAVEETVTAGASELKYDETTGRYSYIWKTDSAWVPSCRQLQLRLNDGETYVANFVFAR